jgi:RHS repeat-associated protein
LLGRTGTSAQPFTYVGAFGVRSEPAANLYQMRARYYDPLSARFLSREPIWPVLDQPRGLDPYQYAYGEPMRFIDRTGLDVEDVYSTPNRVGYIHDYSVIRVGYVHDYARIRVGYIHDYSRIVQRDRAASPFPFSLEDLNELHRSYLMANRLSGGLAEYILRQFDRVWKNWYSKAIKPKHASDTSLPFRVFQVSADSTDNGLPVGPASATQGTDKVTYYWPTFEGFQPRVSYSPESIVPFSPGFDACFQSQNYVNRVLGSGQCPPHPAAGAKPPDNDDPSLKPGMSIYYNF